MKNIFNIFKKTGIYLFLSVFLLSSAFNNKPFFGKIINYQDNRIIMFNNNKIKCFSKELELIWGKQISNIIYDMDIFKERIYVLVNKEILIFSIDGRSIGSISINDNYDKIIVNESIVLLYSDLKQTLDIYHFNNFDYKIKSIMPIDISIMKKDNFNNIYIYISDSLYVYKNNELNFINEYYNLLDFSIYNNSIFILNTRGIYKNDSIIAYNNSFNRICVIKNNIIVIKNGDLLLIKQ